MEIKNKRGEVLHTCEGLRDFSDLDLREAVFGWNGFARCILFLVPISPERIVAGVIFTGEFSTAPT